MYRHCTNIVQTLFNPCSGIVQRLFKACTKIGGRVITLQIKREWFDMILSGEKKEEYREIKPYYKSRFPTTLKVLGI